MTTPFTPATGLLAELPLLRVEVSDALLHVRLLRPAKRNALNDGLILALHHDARFLRSAGAEDRARTAFERLIQHYTLGAPTSAGQAVPTGAAAH